MTTKREQIISKAIEILKNTPEGVHYTELARRIKQELPDIQIKTIYSAIYNLDSTMSNQVYKPARGLFRLITFREIEISEKGKGYEAIKIVRKTKEKPLEENFYQPFADWLANELEECTKAIPLGGSKFKDKWGTPDVIGIRESRRGDIVETPTEIVSAEIKIDTKNLITAFGQACSYKLFSHKSYLVIPKKSSEEDIAKIDALCLIFGIGLILFDNNNVQEPKFEIRARASKQEPDMFYANKYLKLIEKELF